MGAPLIIWIVECDIMLVAYIIFTLTSPCAEFLQFFHFAGVAVPNPFCERARVYDFRQFKLVLRSIVTYFTVKMNVENFQTSQTLVFQLKIM